ncbi:hypothetical protein lerEdw1_000200 [Lerista edwardsae]|nr:hypothetical protein lerEdw1_000200 [Lerista edwardsae]
MDTVSQCLSRHTLPDCSHQPSHPLAAALDSWPCPAPSGDSPTSQLKTKRSIMTTIIREVRSASLASGKECLPGLNVQPAAL